MEIEPKLLEDEALPELDGATGRWTTQEHNLFVQGLKLHGKEWKKIALMIPTRTVVQIRTHAQKYLQKLAKAGYYCNDRGQIEEVSNLQNSPASSSDPIRSSRRPVLNRRYADSEVLEGYMTRSVTSAVTTNTSRNTTPRTHAGSSHSVGHSSATSGPHSSSLSVAETSCDGSVAGSECSEGGNNTLEGINASVGDYGLLQAHMLDAAGNVIKVKVRRVHEAVPEHAYDWRPDVNELANLQPVSYAGAPDDGAAEESAFGLPANVGGKDGRSYSTNDVDGWYFESKAISSTRAEHSRKRSYSTAALHGVAHSPVAMGANLRIDLSKVTSSDEPVFQHDAVASFQALRQTSTEQASARALAEALAGTLHGGITPDASSGMSPAFRTMSISTASTPGRKGNRNRLPSVLSPLDSDSEDDVVTCSSGTTATLNVELSSSLSRPESWFMHHHGLPAIAMKNSASTICYSVPVPLHSSVAPRAMPTSLSVLSGAVATGVPTTAWPPAPTTVTFPAPAPACNIAPSIDDFNRCALSQLCNYPNDGGVSLSAPAAALPEPSALQEANFDPDDFFQ